MVNILLTLVDNCLNLFSPLGYEINEFSILGKVAGEVFYPHKSIFDKRGHVDKRKNNSF